MRDDAYRGEQFLRVLWRSNNNTKKWPLSQNKKHKTLWQFICVSAYVFIALSPSLCTNIYTRTCICMYSHANPKERDDAYRGEQFLRVLWRSNNNTKKWPLSEKSYVCLLIHVCICVCVFMYICVRMCVGMCVGTHVYLYLCLCFVYIYIYIYTYICICVCVFWYIGMGNISHAKQGSWNNTLWERDDAYRGEQFLRVLWRSNNNTKKWPLSQKKSLFANNACICVCNYFTLCVRTYIYVCIYINMYACVYKHIFQYIHTHVYACIVMQTQRSGMMLIVVNNFWESFDDQTTIRKSDRYPWMNVLKLSGNFGCLLYAWYVYACAW